VGHFLSALVWLPAIGFSNQKHVLMPVILSVALPKQNRKLDFVFVFVFY
jgi:hypothetical protein